MMPRRFGWWALGVLVALVQGGKATAQMVVDRHSIRMPAPVGRMYEIREMAVDARIRDQVAEVRVAQTFHNPGSTVIEAEYLFPLPDDAGVQNLVLMVDGQELPGRVLPKDEARRIYEEIVRSKRDPALLEYMGRGLFKASVFPIPPGADRKVTLRYTQLCKRDRDVVEFAYPLATQKHSARPIGKMTLTLRVENRDPIKSVYCPTHDASIARDGEREAKITLERRDTIPTGDFRLVYTVAQGALGATVLSYRPMDGEDGYFLLLASPQVKPLEAKPLPKTVVFVLDRSGSMAGKKLEQARGALQSVLNNLRDGDTFNIVAYDDRVEAFKPELQRYDSTTRAEAEKFVANIREGGSTNIDDALKAALAMVPDDSRPGYVLFLTDGLPTAGETNELKIAANGRSSNKGHARIFSFGVGFDVNAPPPRPPERRGTAGPASTSGPMKTSKPTSGPSTPRSPGPAFASIAVEMSGTDVNRTYPRDLPDLFEGGQLVWVGRYTRGGPATVPALGQGRRRATVVRVPRRSGRARLQFGLRLRREALGRPPGRLHHRPDRPQRRQQGVDRRTGRLEQEIWLADPLYLVPGRRAGQPPRLGGEPHAGDLEPRSPPGGPGPVGASGNARSRGSTRTPTVSRGAKLALSAPAPAGMMGGMGGRGGFAGGVAAGSAEPADPSRRASRPRTPRAPSPTTRSLAGLRWWSGPPPAASRTSPATWGSPSPRGVPTRSRPSTPSRPNPGRKPPTSGTSAPRRSTGRDNRWVDSEVKPDQEARAIVLEQFSDEFFKVARDQTAEQNQYFSFEEPVTVAIAGRVYRIDPPKAK